MGLVHSKTNGKKEIDASKKALAAAINSGAGPKSIAKLKKNIEKAKKKIAKAEKLRDAAKKIAKFKTHLHSLEENVNNKSYVAHLNDNMEKKVRIEAEHAISEAIMYCAD